MEVVTSNNSPCVPARLFIDTVKEVKGCPVLLRTDCGTENGMMAAIQCYFRADAFDSWPEKMLTNTEHPQAIKGLKIGGRTSGKQDPIGG